jgi:lysophospholipase L1-like esterase
MKFDLRNIPADQVYTTERGFGWEPESVYGKSPFYFSIKVPEEGNYRVTMTLGDSKAASVTTVKAELRRLMLEHIELPAGKFEKRTFLVNTRTAKISTGGEVKLKPRETNSEAWAWDDRITLEFTDSHPAVGEVTIEKAEHVPTLYIAGDSTSTDQPVEPFNSWGQMLTRFFQPEIAIANHGESGESLNSFAGAHRLDKIMSIIQPGDYLFIQMGHNDQKEKGEGVGAFTTYAANLKKFVAAARAHQATPVLITSMNRLTFDADGKIANSLGDFPEAVRRVAKEEKVALIDLNAMSKPFYEAMGQVESHKAFAGKDTTHHSNYGSYEFAKCIVEGIRQNHLPIEKFLVPGLPKFDPAHPDPLADFKVPAEPMGTVQKPYGN